MFNWIRNLFTRDVSINSSGRDLLALLGSTPSTTGITVTANTVLSLPPVQRGLQLIGGKCGSIDTITSRRTPNGGKERATTHPAYRLLKYRFAPWLSAQVGKSLLVQSAAIYGNGYAAIHRLGDQPDELTPLDPTNTGPVVTRDSSTGRILNIVYESWIEHRKVILPFEDVIHIRNPILDNSGVVGVGLLDYARETLGLSAATQSYSAMYYKQGGSPRIIVEYPTWLKDKEQQAAFEKGIANVANGLGNAHRALVLWGGAKYVTTSNVSAADAMLIETREANAIDIANALNLPAFKLAARINSSYGSIAEEERALLTDNYHPWFVALENEFAAKLLREDEQENYVIEFNREQLLSMDIASKLDAIEKQTKIGLLSVNEGRTLVGQPRIEEDKADWHLAPGGSFLEAPEPVPVAPQQLPPAEAPEDPPAAPDERGRQLTQLTVARLLTRLRKSGQYDRGDHWQVMVDSLAPFGDKGRDWADTLLTELDAVLPEQRMSVLDRCDVETISEGLWNL